MLAVASGTHDVELVAALLRVADCESDSTWDEGDGGIPPHRGGLQWTPSTWRWLAPEHFPADPADATAAQEIDVAETYRQLEVAQGRGGFGPWPTCAEKLGLPR